MKVLIIHFRSAPSHDLREMSQFTRAGEIDSAGTDGVSLEMMKRRTLLEEMGHKVAICSAYQWADFPIPALEFDSEEVTQMMQNLFGPRLVDFAGVHPFPDELDLSGATPFQRKVWETTRLIPYGETRSYLWVAKQIKRPEAVRVHR